MPRSFNPRTACLKLHEWPERLRLAWELAMGQRLVALSSHGFARGLADRSVEKHVDGCGRYLGFLRFTGRLAQGSSPGECVTPELLDAYFHELLDIGNSDYTIIGRFDELQAAMRIMDPRGCYDWITRPNGQSLRDWLPMQKRELQLHHPTDLFLWGLELMEGARHLNGPKRRQVQLRDGLLIAMEAFRGLRLRSVLSLRLGDSIDKEAETGIWRLAIRPKDVKNARYIDGTLVDILTPWLDRYVAMERRELLDGNEVAAFWINWGGEPLGEVGLDKRIRWWSTKRFGPDGAFGTHRFRHCLASTLPLVAPEHPALASTLLRISHGVMRKHYDRSEDVLAFRKYHAAVDAERKAAKEITHDFFGNPLSKKFAAMGSNLLGDRI